MELLSKYYEGMLIDVDNITTHEAEELLAKKSSKKEQPSDEVTLTEEKLKPKKHLKPILQKLSERKPLDVHYLGTSFGVTKELFNFWRKNEFIPLYLR